MKWKLILINDKTSSLPKLTDFGTIRANSINCSGVILGKDNNVIVSLKERVKNNNVSCTSMTVTLFGDVVSQHGEWVWLGSLIQALESLGFNERSVRTSVYRLTQSDWLEVNKIGRKSYYCFTDSAKSHYERVARRIYVQEPPMWDGQWLLVMPVNVPEEKREEFKKSLLWQGFNMLTNGIYAHPSSDRKSLDEILIEQKLSKDVAVFSASMDDLHSRNVIKDLVNQKWNITELEDFYRDFLTFYRRLNNKIDYDKLSLHESFLLRLSMIHDYRRIQLRDPDLPSELLPTGWVGYEAQDLVKRLYKNLAPTSLDYIKDSLQNAHGQLGDASSKFFMRFGGLD
jgi:phenylacetic acid degradation operon negative regulatory protein